MSAYKELQQREALEIQIKEDYRARELSGCNRFRSQNG